MRAAFVHVQDSIARSGLLEPSSALRSHVLPLQRRVAGLFHIECTCHICHRIAISRMVELLHHVFDARLGVASRRLIEILGSGIGIMVSCVTP